MWPSTYLKQLLGLIGSWMASQLSLSWFIISFNIQFSMTMEGKEESQWPRTTDNRRYYYVLAIVALYALPPLISFPNSLLLSRRGPKLEQAPSIWERVFKWPEGILSVEENQSVLCHLSQITGQWTLKSLCLVFTEFTNVLSTILKWQRHDDPCPLLPYMSFTPGGFQGSSPEETFSDPIRSYNLRITLVRLEQEREGWL